MSALREILAVFDIRVNTDALQAADTLIGNVTDKLMGLGAAAALGVLIHKVSEFGEGMMDNARKVKFNAERMEMNVEEYQKLAQVGENYGMTMEQLQIANTLFVRGLSGAHGTMGEFTQRTAQSAEALRALKVDARQFKGQGLLQILPVIADAFQKVNDPLERVAIGIRLFGHRGRSIMPMLKQGGEALRREFAAMVPVFEEATVDVANKAKIAGLQLGRVWDNLINNSFGKALLSAFTWAANKLTDFLHVVKELSKESEIGNAVLITLGIAAVALAAMVIAAWWPVLLPILAIVAAFAALALIIDDLIVFMEGGHSVTGRLLDKFFGPGGADEVREKVKGIWADLKEFFEGAAVASGKEFFSTVLSLSEKIRNIWHEIRRAVEVVRDAFVEMDKILGPKINQGKINAPDTSETNVVNKVLRFSGDVADAVGFKRDVPLAAETTVPAPRVDPITGSTQNYNANPPPVLISIDARGSEPAAIEHHVRNAMREAAERTNRDAAAGVGGAR